MEIHQMQLRYDPRADRLLWQVRTRVGELYGIWLTRRMALRLWPPFERLMTQATMPTVQSGRANAVPEAQAMMSEWARQRPLPSADFQAPFDQTASSRPLGSDPLLPDHIELTPTPHLPERGLHLRVREEGGRSLQLQLSDELAAALLRLLEQAMKASDWHSVASAPGTMPAASGATAGKPPLAS